MLVSGASGFVGRDLIGRLLARGFRVRAASRNPQAAPPSPGLERIALPDLAVRSDFGPLLDGITDVVHLAGIAHASRAIPEAIYMAVNAEAAATLAQASRRAGAASFVLMSSVRAQSGPAAARVLSEGDAPAPSDAYGRSKLAAERSVAEVLAGNATRGVALRPVLVHGPGVKGNLGSLLRLARLPVPLPLGALANRRSLLGVANLASAVAHAIESEAVGGTYLVADPEPVSVAEIIAALRAGLGRPPGLVRVPLAPMRVALAAIGMGDLWDRLAGDLVVDTGRLRATGWQPVETTAEGLAAMARAASGS
ncbi:MAG: NAD-dependent epimerase/dehydratase family protein [Pseudomonadota bacterium]